MRTGYGAKADMLLAIEEVGMSRSGLEASGEDDRRDAWLPRKRASYTHRLQRGHVILFASSPYPEKI